LVPGAGEARALALRRSGCLFDSDELELAPDALDVEPPQQVADPIGPDSGAAARGREVDHLAALTRIGRTKQGRGARGVAFVGEDQTQPRRLQALRKAGREAPKLL